MRYSQAKALDLDKLPWAAFRAAMTRALQDTIEAATSGALAAAKVAGLSVDAAKVARDVAAMTPGYLKAFLDETIRTTRERTEAAVVAYEAGTISHEEMLLRVDKLFDVDRADLIGVSETSREYAIIGEIIHVDAGIDRVRWDTVRDPFVCPECEALDNEVFPADDAPTPVDDTHPGCRCYLAPVANDIEIAA